MERILVKHLMTVTLGHLVILLVFLGTALASMDLRALKLRPGRERVLTNDVRGDRSGPRRSTLLIIVCEEILDKGITVEPVRLSKLLRLGDLVRDFADVSLVLLLVGLIID